MPFNNAAVLSVSDLLPGAIQGLWTIGDPAGAHAEIGTHPHDGSPSQDESGVRLYAADGVTVLIDLNANGTPTITAAVIQTAKPAAGTAYIRMEGGAAANQTQYGTGAANESQPAVVEGQTGGPASTGQLLGQSPLAPARSSSVWRLYNTGPTTDTGFEVDTLGVIDLWASDMRLSGRPVGRGITLEETQAVGGTIPAGAFTVNIPVVFANPYTAAPMVLAQLISGAGAAIGATWLVFGVTSAGCTIKVNIAAPAPAGGLAVTFHVYAGL